MNIEKGQHQNTFLNTLLALMSIGIYFASEISLPMNFVYSILTVLIILTALLIRIEHRFTFIPFCIIFFLIGVMRFQAVYNLPANDISNFAGEEVNVIGTLRDTPRIKHNADDSFSIRYIVDVEKIQSAQNTIEVSGGLSVSSYYQFESEIPNARLGDKISAYGKIKKPLNFNNPGQLDIVMMMKSDGVNATLSAGRYGVDIEEVEVNLWKNFLRLMSDVRKHYKESMQKVMSNSDASSIFAMLFGGYEGLNPELIESFTTTGIIHILSVSGSHMSLLATTVAWLCNYFRFNRRLTLLIGLTTIFCYTVLSGFLFQVIRSAFMGFLVFFAMSSNTYNSDSRRSLTLIAMILLIINPLSLFHISFQLSFLATAGIIYWSPKIHRYLKIKKFPSYVAMSISTSIAAVIFCQPIIAWYFNQLTISSVIANLIVIPFIELVIILGLIAGTIGLIIPIIAKMIFLFDSLIFGFAYEINKVIADFSFSNIYFPTMNEVWIVFYFALLFLTVQKELNWKHLKIYAVMLTLAIAFNIGMKLTKSDTVELHFIDVHQGDAALLVTPNGHAMMFDCGGVREHKYDIGGRVDVPYLHHYGVTKLDYIFLSHVHEDHSAGAGAIIKKLEVNEIITANESKEEYATVMSTAKESLTNLRPAHQDEVFEVDGVKVEVLFAPKGESNSTGNEISNVYRVTYGKFSALFTGDLVKENESIILQRGIDVNSTVLKVGHHGSKTSSSKEFIEAINPKYAVFCVGADNTFGHPRQEVLNLIEEVGAKIYRTDKNGAIIFETDGESLKIKTKL